MTAYQITNTASGLDLGTYEATSPEAALRAMYDDAGYKGVAVEEIPGDAAELEVVALA